MVESSRKLRAYTTTFLAGNRYVDEYVPIISEGNRIVKNDVKLMFPPAESAKRKILCVISSNLYGM